MRKWCYDIMGIEFRIKPLRPDGYLWTAYRGIHKVSGGFAQTRPRLWVAMLGNGILLRAKFLFS